MRPVALFGSLEHHSSDSWWHIFHFLSHLILVSNVISLSWYPAPAIRSLVICKAPSSEPAGGRGGVMLTWSSSPLTQPAFIWWRCVRTTVLNNSGPYLFIYMLIQVWTCVVAMTAVFIVPCLWHWQQQRACWHDHKYLANIPELSDYSSDRVNSKCRESLLKWRGDKYLASTLGPLMTGPPIWLNVWI